MAIWIVNGAKAVHSVSEEFREWMNEKEKSPGAFDSWMGFRGHRYATPDEVNAELVKQGLPAEPAQVKSK